MDSIAIAVALAAPVLSMPVVLKNFLELKALPRASWRAEYNFAREFGERTGDVHVLAHANDLGYRALVGDSHLNTADRKLLMSLANRTVLIPKYLRAKDLLSLHAESPVFRWKRRRHESRLTRTMLMNTYYAVYFLAAMVVVVPLITRLIPSEATVMFGFVKQIPDWITLYFLILAIASLHHGVRLDIANDVVRDAALEVLPPENDMQD